MVVVKSDIGDKGARFIDDIEKQVIAATTMAMKKTGIVGEARVKSIMQKEAYDTGRLLRSVNSRIVTLPAELTLIVGTNLQYAINIEKGRLPGKWPNLDALVSWVGRKLRRQGVNAKVNVSFDQLKQLAKSGGRTATAQQKAYRIQLATVFLVGRKIAVRGIKQKLIFKRIEAGLLAYFRVELQKQLNLIR